ncbi:MAG: O-antigen polymerase [Croceibacterium sp.]
MNAAATYELMLYASCLVFAAVALTYARSSSASLFHPATGYLAFHFIVFALRPLFAFYGNYNTIYVAYHFQPSWSDKNTVILGANLGLIVFVAAAMRWGRDTLGFESRDDDRTEYVVPVLIACFVCGIPALWSLITNFQISAGIRESGITMDLATGTVINKTGNGYFFEASLMMATLAGMFAYVFRFRWWSFLPLFAFVILRGGIGGRGPIIAAIFFMILLYSYAHKRYWLNLKTAGLMVAALAIFRVVGDDRGAAIREFVGFKSGPVRSQVLRFLEAMDWANLEFFEYLVYVVPQRSKSYDYFLAELQIFTEPIPRILWTGKPIGAPIKLFDLWHYGQPIGMTYSLPGAGWFELGWIGIIVLSAFFAWIYAAAFSRFARSRRGAFSVMLYCAFLTTSIVAFRDGQLMTVLRQSLFYLAPVLVMEATARVQRGPSEDQRRRQQKLRTEVGSTARPSPGERRRKRAALVGGG